MGALDRVADMFCKVDELVRVPLLGHPAPKWLQERVEWDKACLDAESVYEVDLSVPVKQLQQFVEDIARTTVVPRNEVMRMVSGNLVLGGDINDTLQLVRRVCEERTRGYLNRRVE